MSEMGGVNGAPRGPGAGQLPVQVEAPHGGTVTGVPSPLAGRLSKKVNGKSLRLWLLVSALPLLLVAGMFTLAVVAIAGQAQSESAAGARVDTAGVMGVPEDAIVAYVNAGIDTNVPWEILAALGNFATVHGTKVPGDAVQRGSSPGTSPFPTAVPAIVVERDGRRYLGPLLIDELAVEQAAELGRRFDPQNLEDSAIWVGGWLNRVVAASTSPQWSRNSQDWVAERDLWQRAVERLPVMGQLVAIPEWEKTVACDATNPLLVVGDVGTVEAAAFSPPATNLRVTVPAATVEGMYQAAVAAYRPGERVVVGLPIGPPAGGWSSGSAVDPAGLLDRFVELTGDPDLVTFVRPRATDFAWDDELNDELVEFKARHGGRGVYVDGSSWTFNDFDMAAVTDPVTGVVSYPDFGADGVSPNVSAIENYREWLLPKLCVMSLTQKEGVEAEQSASGLASQAVSFAVAIATNQPMPLFCGATTGELGQILLTIRTMESGNDYGNNEHSVALDGRNSSGNPTGAYQFVYTSWGKYAGYDEAYQAPPHVQDERASLGVTAALDAFGGDFRWVPIVWYVGTGGAKRVQANDVDYVQSKGWRLAEGGDPAVAGDYIPNPRYNRLSPFEYQAKWLERYESLGGAPAGDVPVSTVVAGSSTTVVPDGSLPALSPVGADCASAVVSPTIEGMMQWGRSMMGSPYAAIDPYRFGEPPWPGGTKRGGRGDMYTFPAGTVVFDCSGFVVAAYRKIGVELKANSSWEMAAASWLTTVDRSDLQVGDIIVYHPDAKGIGHVVLYAGNGKTLEASPKNGVWSYNVNWERVRVIKRVPDLPSASSAPAPGGQRCTSLQHVGDSTTAMMVEEMEAAYARTAFRSVSISAGGGRAVSQKLSSDQFTGLTAVDHAKAGGFSGCWVVALGTNDTANIAAGANFTRAGEIDKMMARIDPTRSVPVVWVNVWSSTSSGSWSQSNMRLWNQALVAAQQRWPNLIVLDWAGHVSPAWFADSVHYTSAGSLSRAEFVASRVSALLIGS